MRPRRGRRGQFSSLYGTSTLRLGAEFPYPPGGARYERLVFDADGQLIVPVNEWYRLMRGIGAARTRDTYLAVLRPWFGFPGQAQLSMECSTRGSSRVHPVVLAGGRLCAPIRPRRGLVRPGHQPVADERQWLA